MLQIIENSRLEKCPNIQVLAALTLLDIIALLSLWEKNYQTGLLKAFSVKHLGIEKLIETHD